MVDKQPPRAIAPGDIVAVYSDALGAWTASQIIQVKPEIQRATVLELDWHGPEPASAADLGDVRPLRLTHHSWNNSLAYCHHEWTLPRSFTVIGSLPPLTGDECPAFAMYGWGRGTQLAAQRRWDAGERGTWEDPKALRSSAVDLQLGRPRPDITDLTVYGVDTLDCEALVATYPNLTALSLSGSLGVLESAGSLRGLTALSQLYVRELFGMTEADCLPPRDLPVLELLFMYSVPAAYAQAMRKVWRKEAHLGVCVDISGARKPEWVAENANNPLRDWQDREHIPRGSYRKAVEQYKATRTAFAAAVSDDAPAETYFGIGRDFAERFNMLDAKTFFIETVERDELFDALMTVVAEAQSASSHELLEERRQLIDGADSVRDW